MKYLTLSQVTNLYTKITKGIHFCTMNDPENKACQHVLHLIDTFKDTPIIQEIQDLLIEISITVD
jgi:hypothetical protein